MSKIEPQKKTIQVPVRIPSADGKSVVETRIVEVECTICPHTGEELLDGKALQKLDRVKARYMGILLPEQIKALREQLDLTQSRMGELLQIGAKTYSRWETGRERPSRSLNLLLRALADGKVSATYLRCLREPVDEAWAPTATYTTAPLLYIQHAMDRPAKGNTSNWGDQNAA